ncbi:MAG: leucyl aminopeptidase family protein [Pseudomonadota bacterium]
MSHRARFAVYDLSDQKPPNPVPVSLVPKSEAKAFLEGLDERSRTIAEHQGFGAGSTRPLILPKADGTPAHIVQVIDEDGPPFQTAALRDAAKHLAGYSLEVTDWGGLDPVSVASGWALGAYRFDRFKAAGDGEDDDTSPIAPLYIEDDAVRQQAVALADAVFLTRDLINRPANDLGPAELAEAALVLAARFDAECTVLDDPARIASDFPLLEAVGKGSPRAPRLIDLTWGDPQHPAVTLVGKGVCFDTGGLNLKPDGAMALMKKDMSGSANALGLASLIMAAKLGVRLRVLIPAVENSVSGPSFRPGDVYPSRLGLTVEIGNTDAEGRLVLADAMAYGCEAAPDTLIVLASLTGAARVALGPDVVPFYTHSDDLAAELAASSAAVGDPLWRLPLWQPYAKLLDSKVADLNNIASMPMAGSVTAALFLEKFAGGAREFLHCDLFGWSPKAKPGAPVGGEAQAIRAIFHMLKERHG